MFFMCVLLFVTVLVVAELKRKTCVERKICALLYWGLFTFFAFKVKVSFLFVVWFWAYGLLLLWY